MIDHVVADALGVRYLREALDAGEPSRITRGLGYEAAFEALIGGPLFARRSRDLLDRMDDAARGSPDPYDRAWSVMSRGITAWLHADWATAAALCDEAAATYRSHCRGIAWELAITDSYTLPALAYLGRLDELARRAPAAARDAESRGDVFAANMCRLGLANMVHLLDDRPEAALAEARAALAPFDGDTYLLPHYHHAIAVVQAELYRASPEAALAHIEAAWRGLGEAQFLRAQCVRAELHHLRGRAALAAASRRRDPSAALRLVEASARALADDTLPLAPPFAAALRAGAAAVTGHAGRAAALLSDARAGFARAGMAIYEAAARARLAELRGDAAGAGEARAFFAAQGARDPEAMIAMLLPGVGVTRRPCP